MVQGQIYKCPHCGADVSIDDSRAKAFCSYCGAEILLNNENEQVYRHIDEAEVTRAETERIVKLHEIKEKSDKAIEKELEKEELRKRSMYVVFSTLIILVCCLLLRWIIKMLGGGGTFIFYYLKHVIIIDIIILIADIIIAIRLAKADSLTNKVEEQEPLGYISLPNEIVYYDKMKYTDMNKLLIDAGFTNISCVPLYDLTTGLLTKPKTIENISVNGQDSTTGIPMKCAPDSKIIISYHELSSKENWNLGEGLWEY